MNEKNTVKRPRPPIGLAKRLNMIAEKNFQRRLAFFSEVKNIVIYVNPEFYIPFKLEEGKESPLGLFAKSAIKRRKPKVYHKNRIPFELWASNHSRSSLLGRIIITDKQGNLYRDIDLKGNGYTEESYVSDKDNWSKIIIRRLRDDRGLARKDWALHDANLSEEFHRLGIRTHRVLAIIKLKQVILQESKETSLVGRLLPVRQAREEGTIAKNIIPVIQVRAFATKFRVKDLSYDYASEAEKKTFLSDARRIVSQELGRERNPLSYQEYIEWFAKTLGRNVGLMHKNGWYHNYLSDHNVTLDCRIVDLDSVKVLRYESWRQREFEKAKGLLSNLFRLVSPFLSRKEEFNHKREESVRELESKLPNLFEESYNSVFPEEERERYFKRRRKKRAR